MEKWFREEQIAYALKRHETGIPAKDICLARVCGLVRLWRSSYYYKSRASDIRPLLMRLKELAAARPRFGYKRLWLLLRRKG